MLKQQNHHISTLSESNENLPKAYMLGICSYSSIVVMQLFMRHLCAYFPAFMILALRSGLIAFIYIIILQFKGISFDIKNSDVFKLLCKRSLISALTMTMYMASVQYIPIGIGATLFNMAPLFTFFTEALYFKKFSIQWIHLFITFLCFCGIILIVQPQFLFGIKENEIPSFHFVLYGLVIFAAFTSTFSMILVHDLRNSVDEYVTLAYGAYFHSIFNYFLYMRFVNSFDEYPQVNVLPANMNDVGIFLGLLIVFTMLAFVVQYSRVRSMYLAKPSKIMPFQYVSVVFGMLIDVFIFQADYDFYMIIGAFLASCGLLAKVLVEQQKGKS